MMLIDVAELDSYVEVFRNLKCTSRDLCTGFQPISPCPYVWILY